MTYSVRALTLMAFAMPTTSWACGGFFCNNVSPVVQSAERILFHPIEDGRLETWVEVQYEGEPTDFAWILPVPSTMVIDDVTVAPPGVFDALEELTGPRFVDGAAFADMDASAEGMSRQRRGGCLFGPRNDVGFSDDMVMVEPDISGVEVVGEAVVGPYAVELITATEGANLINWLQLNNYQFPLNAEALVQHYLDLDMAFVGLKMAPEVASGPIDTLVLTFEAANPSIPLLLTGIAASQNMEITTYVLAEERYAPANFEELNFNYDDVLWTGVEQETDYEIRLANAQNEVGGKAWVTEYARPVSQADPLPEALLSRVGDGAYLSRFHGFLDPDEMTRDPVWIAAPDKDDVGNVHEVWGSVDGVGRGQGGGWPMALLPLMVGGLWMRRKRV